MGSNLLHCQFSSEHIIDLTPSSTSVDILFRARFELLVKDPFFWLPENSVLDFCISPTRPTSDMIIWHMLLSTAIGISRNRIFESIRQSAF
jgi:hypothetical protein